MDYDQDRVDEITLVLLADQFQRSCWGANLEGARQERRGRKTLKGAI
jgi:hypothetical protein